MKTRKSIIATAIIAAMFSGAALADDVNTVYSTEARAQAYQAVVQTVDPRITIQDYIEAANRDNGFDAANSKSTADNASRWEAERAL